MADTGMRTQNNTQMNTQVNVSQSTPHHLYSVDICRFIAALMIMAHHSYLFGMEGDFFGANGYLWVEYFFMLTGYLTMAHFKKHPIANGNYGKTAVQYTLHKFKSIIPMTTVAIIIFYILNAMVFSRVGNQSQWWPILRDMPLEICMLSSGGFFIAYLSPIWFLSAMFLMLPILIYVMNRFDDAWYILSFLIPIIYYGKMGFNSVRDWPNDMLRAFVAMALGSFIYYIVQKLKEMDWNESSKLAITIVELASFVWIVLITGRNLDLTNLLLLLMPLQLSLMLSGCSYTSRINGKVFAWLGQMSLPMFVFQWIIAVGVQALSHSLEMRNILYYSITIVIAVMICILQNIIKQKNK